MEILGRTITTITVFAILKREEKKANDCRGEFDDLRKQQLQDQLHRQNIDNLEQHLASIVMHMNVSQS